jgi:hypothetical protein
MKQPHPITQTPGATIVITYTLKIEALKWRHMLAWLDNEIPFSALFIPSIDAPDATIILPNAKSLALKGQKQGFPAQLPANGLVLATLQYNAAPTAPVRLNCDLTCSQSDLGVVASVIDAAAPLLGLVPTVGTYLKMAASGASAVLGAIKQSTYSDMESWELATGAPGFLQDSSQPGAAAAPAPFPEVRFANTFVKFSLS